MVLITDASSRQLLQGSEKNQLRYLISILHRWENSTAAKAAESQKSLWCSIDIHSVIYMTLTTDFKV